MIAILDRNEDPEALRSTVIKLAMTNVVKEIFLGIDRDHFRVQKIIVSDQSDFDIAKINRDLLYAVKDVLTNALGKANNLFVKTISRDFKRYGLKFGSQKKKGPPWVGDKRAERVRNEGRRIRDVAPVFSFFGVSNGLAGIGRTEGEGHRGESFRETTH